MIVIVMGVVGAGKTTVGMLLAEQLGWKFADADDFHSKSNVEKIRQGIPLSDADREPWVEALRKQIEQWISNKQNAVLACSALKQSYREKLAAGPEVRFVHLKGPAALIAERLRLRLGHFAGEAILTSQIRDLEEPHDAAAIEVDRTPSEIVSEIRKKLGLG